MYHPQCRPLTTGLPLPNVVLSRPKQSQSARGPLWLSGAVLLYARSKVKPRGAKECTSATASRLSWASRAKRVRATERLSAKASEPPALELGATKRSNHGVTEQRSVQATGQLYPKRVAQHALGRSVKRQAEGASLISVEHPERVNHETRLNAPSPDGD